MAASAGPAIRRRTRRQEMIPGLERDLADRRGAARIEGFQMKEFFRRDLQRRQQIERQIQFVPAIGQNGRARNRPVRPKARPPRG